MLSSTVKAVGPGPGREKSELGRESAFSPPNGACVCLLFLHLWVPPDKLPRGLQLLTELCCFLLAPGVSEQGDRGLSPDPRNQYR